jgi:type IV pilus assembly protein PilW
MRLAIPRSGSSRRQSGLSLIELMIALALGLVLTLGVVQVFLGSSKTYRLTDSLGKVQENIRFTMGALQYDARMAGHFGCLIGPPFNQLDEGDDDYDGISYDGFAVVGWNADGTGIGDDFTITTLEAGGGTWTNGGVGDIPDAIENDVLPGTDFIVVNGGQKSLVELDINPSANANTLGTTGNVSIDKDSILLVVASDCSGGDLFQKTNQSGDTLTKGSGNAPGNKTPVNEKFDGDYDDDASVYTFTSTAYFIGEGANDEPALFRERLDPGDTIGAVEMAEGVENMQILYGVASGVGQTADNYVTAAGVTNWDQVVSVRMALLYRTGDNITDAAEAGVFNLASTEITTQSDRRSRVVGLSTVGIRNRLE